MKQRMATGPGARIHQRFERRLHRIYAVYTFGFLGFVGALALLERAGVSRDWIGFIFLIATVAVYAVIGVTSRTSDAAEYYVAGRKVPALYNGMAIGADWMSAASYIGMAGTLYLTGFAGLAYVMGWTGGFCLVALLLAPYLRRFGQFTIPDFLGARYDSHVPRFIGLCAAVLVSFVYVVAQIYGVGLITSRLTGFAFEVGIFVGLGGVLVCSFLGGMKAVTWTQVAQYIVLVIAYLVPVAWLSMKQTGVPVPQLVYGHQLQKVTAREAELRADPKEQQVIEIFRARASEAAAKLNHVGVQMVTERESAQQKLEELKAANAPLVQIQAAERTLLSQPRTEAEARTRYQAEKAAAESRAKPLGGMPPHGQAFAGDPKGNPSDRAAFDDSRRNFLALVFCLALGTAALPHVLTRLYTTPTVQAARASVGWAVLFIVLLYVTAPALAVLVKYEVLSVLVGTPFDRLPAWIASWSKLDPSLLSVADVNSDGILQLGEIRIGGDIIVLAMPEIAGLPFVISGMVAAGGLAAALSTADALLLTIASALSHDLYYRILDPTASVARRVTISKVLLLAVALGAAYVAALKIADIVFLVSAAFSLAASSLFPALVLGVFWRRANRWGASAGMLAGLGVCMVYMATTQPWLMELFRVGGTPADHLWFGIAPIAAGVFGVPVATAVTVVVSLLTPRPSRACIDVVELIRNPVAQEFEPNG